MCGGQFFIAGWAKNVTLSSSAEYSQDGNRLLSTTDAAGKVTTYGYNADTNVLEWVQYPEDTEATRTEYTYDEMYRLASAAADVSTGTTLMASYIYENDLLTSITTGSTTYNFSYGDFSLRSSIKIGSRTLASYSYTDRNNFLASLDYGNGDSVDYTYDKQGRVTMQTYEDGDTVAYKYDNNGALATVTDSDTGITTTYYYDFTERLMKYVESDGTNTHIVSYEYDTINNLTALVETINGTSHTTSYEYDIDNRITSVTNDSTVKSYTYDAYSRVSGQVIKNGSTEVLTTSYAYRNPTDTTTTGQVSSLAIDAGSFDVVYTYTYDDNGNILSVSDGTYTTSYVYDTAGQLLRENNQAAGKTWVWTYDNAGNIKTRKEYAYTTDTVGAATDTVTYTYGDSSWGDLLTAYDGVAITYDDIGNPLTDGTWTYTWEHGRELASMTDGSTTWTYTYDANGMRTSRSDGTTTYKYVYNGSSLVQMTVGSNTLYFTSDTVTLNGTTYYYVTNLQGDIVAILNSGGTAVVQYTYDAWGNILSISDTSGVNLGTLNPLRYRGYVYDPESGLYYLQSRYYDPEIGRWINADSAISGTGGDLLGYNMFAYCFNNPANMSDPTGNWPKWFETTVKVVSVVVAVAAVVATAAAVSAFTAGTGSAVAVYVATIGLGAALSGINGGVANEAKGNSYTNGYIGGATGGAIQATCSKTPVGTIIGGGIGVTVGTAVTDIMNNWDPDSMDSTAHKIVTNAITSGGKALVASSLTAYMGYASDLSISNGANKLMPTYTFGFGEAVKTFFGWLDDAIVYTWE